MKRENTRLDVASRKPYPKSQLLRIVSFLGAVVPDKEGELPGRGLYLHKDQASFQLALKKKAFERAFHRPLTPEEMQKIQEAL